VGPCIYTNYPYSSEEKLANIGVILDHYYDIGPILAQYSCYRDGPSPANNFSDSPEKVR
jgi:hypothetical protein